jgi:hypothetical protein
MKAGKIILFVLAAGVGIAIVFAVAKILGGDSSVTDRALSKETGTAQEKIYNFPIFEEKTTGSMSSGDAVLELTPAIVSKNSLIVKFRFNTHSVSMNSMDLKEMTTLEYNGKVLKPVKASRVGGHHTTGSIVFETGEDVGSFTIKIKGIPNIEERIYEWKLG